MTSFKTIRRFSLAAVAFFCSAAFAADNQNMQVSATVSGVCKLTSVPAMDFGALDPSLTNDGAGTSLIEYKCTKGTVPSFAVGTATTTGGTFNGVLTGQTVTPTSPADTINYFIKWTAPTAAGTGFGTGSSAASVTLTGEIPYANFQNAKADTYKQTVAIILNN